MVLWRLLVLQQEHERVSETEEFFRRWTVSLELSTCYITWQRHLTCTVIKRLLKTLLFVYGCGAQWLLLFCAVYKYSYLLTYLLTHSVVPNVRNVRNVRGKTRFNSCYFLNVTGRFRGKQGAMPPRCQDPWLPYCYVRFDSRCLRRLLSISQSRSASAERIFVFRFSELFIPAANIVVYYYIISCVYRRTRRQQHPEMYETVAMWPIFA